MRRHHESLNYFDTQAGTHRFSFSRTQGQEKGLLTATDTYYDSHNDMDITYEMTLTEEEAYTLRDMLNEVLEDWK